MDNRIQTYEKISGIIIFLIVCIICIFVFLKLSQKSLFERPEYYYLEMPRGMDLQVNDQVKVNGLKAGTISKTEMTDSRNVRVTLKLYSYFDFLREDSQVLVYPPFMIQKAFIDIEPGSDTSPRLPAGGTFASSKIKINPTFNQAVINLTDDIQSSSNLLNQTLKNLRTGLKNIVELTEGILDKKSSVGAFLHDDKAIYRSMTDLMTASNRLLQKLEKSSRNVDLVAQ
ncbi:MlaD family protein, partial [Candidatus Riflebacteria bacterium]